MKINSFRYSYSCEIKDHFQLLFQTNCWFIIAPSGKHFSAETNYCWMILSDLIYINGLKKNLFLFHPISLHIFFQFYHANEYMPSRIIIVNSSNFLKIKSFKLSRWCFSHCKFSIIITYIRHKIKALSVKCWVFFQNCIKISDMSEKVQILYK